jgi:hypothetical protein
MPYPAQWRMGQVAQDMPETDQSATEFVIEGDTVLCDARIEVAAAEESVMAIAWATPIWHCMTQESTMLRHARNL